jgi:hypothetical protein
VAVLLGVTVGLEVEVLVVVGLGVSEGVADAISLGVAVGVDVFEAVTVALGVALSVGVGVSDAVRVGVKVTDGVPVAVLVVVGVAVAVFAGVRLTVALGVADGVAVTVDVGVGIPAGIRNSYWASSVRGGCATLLATMRSRAEPGWSADASPVARKPATPRARPSLQGSAAGEASSHGSRSISIGWSAEESCRTDASMEAASRGDAASTTVKRIETGSDDTSSPTAGCKLSSIRKGRDGTGMSPASLTSPATICTALRALSKLGVLKRPAAQAKPTPEGSVGQVSVMPGGAGAPVPANPAMAIVAGPVGNGCRTIRRCPLTGSAAIVRGSTARQQANPDSDSKTKRTVLTEGGSSGPKPTSGGSSP